MDEVQLVAVAECSQDSALVCSTGSWFLQGDQPVEAEDGVIEVARARAILKPAVGIELLAQKAGDQIARLTELRRRQPGDLQHLEPQTHCTNP